MREELENLNVQEIQATLQPVDFDCKDALNRAFSYLTSSDVGNFYARVLASLDRYTAPGFGTMGVTLTRGRYVLVYDPAFVARVSYDELCATCEHEVLHIVLEHIPRYLRLLKLYKNSDDEALMEIVRNLAQDVADNELLARNFKGIKDLANKPLGTWIVPESFQPRLPPDLSMESYQDLLLHTLKQKMKSDPEDMLELAKNILQSSIQAAINSVQGKPGQGQSSQDPEGSGGGGQGPGSGQPSPGGQAPNPQDLQDQLDKLDPVDQEIMKQLLSSMHSHHQWTAGVREDPEAEAHHGAEHGRELMKSALNNQQKLRGTIPGYMQELIRKMLVPPVVPWTQFLHNAIQRTRQTKKQRGMSRPSKVLSAVKKFVQMNEDDDSPRLGAMRALAHMRRMPVFPGVKHENKYTLYVAVDTSGSMGNDELKRALSEIQHIQRSDSDIRVCVMYVDTAVCKAYWVGPHQELDYGLTGRGGTDFNPVFTYINEQQSSYDNAPDLLVYITDGYAPPPSVKISIPTVWVITPRGRPCCTDAGHITIEMRDYLVTEVED